MVIGETKNSFEESNAYVELNHNLKQEIYLKTAHLQSNILHGYFDFKNTDLQTILDKLREIERLWT